MGKFIYDAIVKVDFEDRLLAHLQLVIGAKMRRGESFHFTWKDDPSIGDGRTTVWIHPRVLGRLQVLREQASRHQPRVGGRPGLHRQLADRTLRRTGARGIRRRRERTT